MIASLLARAAKPAGGVRRCGWSGGDPCMKDGHRGQVVLVVDYGHGLIELITHRLTWVGGHRVVAATDGATGLERFFEVLPDCVVVDVRMPGLNGYQFMRALRGDPETAHTPIIVLSAMAQERDTLAGML